MSHISFKELRKNQLVSEYLTSLSQRSQKKEDTTFTALFTIFQPRSQVIRFQYGVITDEKESMNLLSQQPSDLHVIFKDNSGRAISIFVLPRTHLKVLQDIWQNTWVNFSLIQNLKPSEDITVVEISRKSEYTALTKLLSVIILHSTLT